MCSPRCAYLQYAPCSPTLRCADRDCDTAQFAGSKQQSKAAEPSAKAEWQPSARVLALTEEQQQETRERLNIVIDDSAGKPISPIESFDEMVFHTSSSAICTKASVPAEELTASSRRRMYNWDLVSHIFRKDACDQHAAAICAGSE